MNLKPHTSIDTAIALCLRDDIVLSHKFNNCN